MGILASSQTLIDADTSVRKSQIAIEYAYRFRQTRPQSHVLWVYAASYTTFVQACHDIARSLKLPTCDEPGTDPCELVSKWLNEEDHSWLIILDNADNAELFFPSVGSDSPPATVTQPQRSLNDYLPSILNPQKSLLVTTKSRLVGQDLAHGELCVEVPALSPQEAMELLRLKLKGSASSFDVSSTTERLLDVLGYIPLAITQAAAFINGNRWTVQGYLAALEKDKQNMTDHLSQELQDHRRPRGFPNSVFRTWKLSFDQILVQEPQTAKFLSLMAMLDPQQIPEKLLRPLAEREVDFRMAISTLDGFALISQEIGGQTYAMHPLVQASVHYWLEQKSEFNHRSSRSYRQSIQDPSSSEADQTTNRNTSAQDTQVTRDRSQLEHNGREEPSIQPNWTNSSVMRNFLDSGDEFSWPPEVGHTTGNHCDLKSATIPLMWMMMISDKGLAIVDRYQTTPNFKFRRTFVVKTIRSPSRCVR